MTRTKHDLMAIMSQHCGAERGISVRTLAELMGVSERRVRRFITAAREDGIAICGHPVTGYYIARTAAEMEVTIEFLKARALHSLRLASRLSRIPLTDLIGQLRLKT